MSTYLPLELFDCIAEFVADQQTLLALTRSLPYAPISINRLFHFIRITHPDTVPKLYRRIRSGFPSSTSSDRDENLDSGNNHIIRTFDASGLVHHLAVESWTVDADVLINLLRLLPNLWTLNLWIGPSNFSPEHLEEMFKPPMRSLEYLSLRFRPYVKKATYYQFLKGSYFDSTLLAIAAWPPSSKGLPTLSIVQDAFIPDPNDPIPRFAQPIVFFRLDLHLSVLVHSPASQRSLTFLRVRIPARPIIQSLTVAYLHPTDPNPDTNPDPPPLKFLDIATCAVSEADVEKLLVRFTCLKHLVLDACTSLLRSGSPQTSGAELDWWFALGRRLALTGVKRAKEREKELKAWYEARQRTLFPPDMLDDIQEGQQHQEQKRVRKGRKGLATATITLRGSATSPPRAGARRPSPVRPRQPQTAATASSSSSVTGQLNVTSDLHQEEDGSTNELSASGDEHKSDEGFDDMETKPSPTPEKKPRSLTRNPGKRRAVPSKTIPEPSSIQRSKLRPIPKLYIIPPLPILSSLSLFPASAQNAPPSTGINHDIQVQIRAEFERGWNDGLRVIWEVRARLGMTFSRSQDDDRNKGKGKGKTKEDTPKPRFFMLKDRKMWRDIYHSDDEEAEEEKEGHEGLQGVFPGMEDIFFRSEATLIDCGAPVLCLAGSGVDSTGHASGCGHFIGNQAGLERL
ncbi:hypothetical protein H0H87_008339 [Tephrocybe sp. NHM501043]|nr:hypothetical protein H0H87_008339 [Tephrocybe sp. NHM501043]